MTPDEQTISEILSLDGGERFKVVNVLVKKRAIAFGEFLADYHTNDYKYYYHRADGHKPFREVKFYEMPDLYAIFSTTQH